MTPSTPPDSVRMQCMEVWGGNAPEERELSTPGLQAWLHSRPYQGAAGGGDVYYVSSCASGRITRLLLADVSGHGEHVAPLAIGLRELMRRNINWIDQTRLVREMNRQFAQQPGDAGFATAIVCTFFSPLCSLQLSNAGHPPPLLYRARQNQWSIADQTASAETGGGPADTPLGVVDGADYSQFTTRLAQGDMVLLFSDAFTESRDSAGNLLGPQRLLRLVASLPAAQPSQIIPSLHARLVAERADNLREDDATALLFRADGSGIPLANNLLAPFRLLGSVRDQTTLDV